MKRECWRMIFGGFIIVFFLTSFFILLYKVTSDIIEVVENQKITKQKTKFNICLQGCMFYEDAIPYINNTRVVYFDFCANDCNDKYLEEV